MTFVLEIFSEGKGAAEEGTSGKAKGKKRKAAAENDVALKDFTVEYAKSSRSTCRGCEEKIMKVCAFVCVCMRMREGEASTPINQSKGVRLEVFTELTVKNVVFWDIITQFYFTVDTLRLRYRVQPVNAM
jgi:hypothetical protein